MIRGAARCGPGCGILINKNFQSLWRSGLSEKCCTILQEFILITVPLAPAIVITILCPKRYRLCYYLYFFMCRITSTQSMFLALHFLSARSSVDRGETGGLETCFTCRSSSYSDTYVVREGQKLSNTMDGESHLHA
ncbi:hypothetical protein EDD85DRAFT_99087 [Armillaria nabsnona]|nr:hypothetical protein EDD85DRAFT_99087 [Armillaria nabsnona]